MHCIVFVVVGILVFASLFTIVHAHLGKPFPRRKRRLHFSQTNIYNYYTYYSLSAVISFTQMLRFGSLEEERGGGGILLFAYYFAWQYYTRISPVRTAGAHTLARIHSVKIIVLQWKVVVQCSHFVLFYIILCIIIMCFLLKVSSLHQASRMWKTLEIYFH